MHEKYAVNKKIDTQSINDNTDANSIQNDAQQRSTESPVTPGIHFMPYTP